LLDAKAKLTSVSNEGVVIRVEYSDLSSNEWVTKVFYCLIKTVIVKLILSITITKNWLH
jgi:hypothetical protein